MKLKQALKMIKIVILAIFFASNQIYNNLLIENTCSIDYFLLSIWFSSLNSSNVSNVIQSKENDKTFKNLSNIVKLIENDNWNRTKTVWFLTISKMSPNDKLDFN